MHDLCITDEKTEKCAYHKGQRLIGMSYDTIVYRITQLHVFLKVEPHLRSCIARLQMLRNGSRNDLTLERLSDKERLKGNYLLQKREKYLKSGKNPI